MLVLKMLAFMLSMPMNLTTMQRVPGVRIVKKIKRPCMKEISISFCQN